ncbi:guanine nucleotide exchange factor VAV3 isoform X2 [Ixodes scapularis]
MKKKWIEAIEKAMDNINPSIAKDTDHQFAMHTFKVPTYCSDCNKLLPGIFYQGYICSVCGTGVHKTCLATVRSCGAPSLPPRPGSHMGSQSSTDEPQTPLRLYPDPGTNGIRFSISIAKAKQSYNSSGPGYLSFAADDIIEVLRRISSTIWEGRLQRTSEEGLFPASCVEEVRALRGKIRRRVEEGIPLRKDSMEWREYQDRKVEVTTLIQTKMAKADKRFLEDLKEAGREAPRKFWRHVRDQTGKPREDPMLKDDTTGRQLGPRETIQYIEERVRSMFAGSSTDAVDENGRPEGLVQREVQSSMDNITRGELKKAMGRMGATTATGLDNLPMRLVKEMGPETRELLQQTLSQIMRRGRIPAE